MREDRKPESTTMAVLWISLAVVLGDQLTKMLVKGSPWTFLPFHGMQYGTSIPLIDDIIRITYIENPGIAFGINFPSFKVFFSLFSVVASIGILWYLKRNIARLSRWERIGLALVLGGAVGNLIDRVFYGVIYGTQPLFYGRVVDFVDFGIHRNMFPVFNVADSAVTIGVSILIAIMLFKKPPVTTTDAIAVDGNPEVTSGNGEANGSGEAKGAGEASA